VDRQKANRESNMKRVLVGLVLIVFLAIAPVSGLQSGAYSDKRIITGQTLASYALPAVSIKFDNAFRYVGSQSFVLYDVANAEQHFFIDADKQGRIKRMYWVQFEGYLSNNSEVYDYKVNQTVNLGMFTFIADAQARSVSGNPGRPESDGYRARAFLEAKGYRMGSSEVLWQRLVHMADAAKRNELMIIYLEDLSLMGLTAADLAAGGKAHARWEKISKELLKRALDGMKIKPV
jgi:hypothetical protein